MKLIYSFNILYNKEIYNLCKVSKNLYNQALYIVKKELEESNNWLWYNDLNKIMKTTVNLDGNINYKLLKAQVSQQCLKQLDTNIKSYIKIVKDYSKNPSKYKGKPCFPKYKKEEVNLLIYTNQVCTIKKDGFIHLSKKDNLKIHIPQFEKYKDKLNKFQQVRIIPLLDKSFKVEIIYECKQELNSSLNYDLYSSVDLGVNNLVTMVLPDNNPMLFNGKQVKAKNQYFNKTISKLQSKLPKGKHKSKRINRLWVKRDNYLNDFFHKLTRCIVRTLVKQGVGNIVVGYNRGLKDSIRISKRNNQTFVSIPYLNMLQKLKYKCELTGINVIVNEESYTSKCDSLVLESVEKHESYLGKRVKRGLFQSSIGKLLNADVNGALNILRKVVGDSSLIERIINSGCLYHPKRINVFSV